MTVEGRHLEGPEATANLRQFAADVARDLTRQPRQLQAKYLYDELGSSLFQAITHLPWYRITRAERALLEEQAAAIAGRLTDPATLVELGCGNGEKLAVLARALSQAGRPAQVQLIDLSPAALEEAERRLARLPGISVVEHPVSYEEGLLRAARQRRGGGTLLVLFLGSNIGNFDPHLTLDFLAQVRARLRPGDALLLGADLVKGEGELLLAYDDPLGVTAAFNKNLLLRINRELGADFDLSGFDHRIVWNRAHSRVEMHLVSRREQVVTIPAADCTVRLASGESIWTESSYKYTPEQILSLGQATGFSPLEQWIDSDAGFALTLLGAA